MSLVVGVRWSFRGKDAGSVRVTMTRSVGATEDAASGRAARPDNTAGIPPDPPQPPWSKGDDAGPSTRRCGFDSRRGFFRLAVGKMAIPPVSGTGDRWFDSSRPDRAR